MALLKFTVEAERVAKNPQRHKLLKGHWVAVPELLVHGDKEAACSQGKLSTPRSSPSVFKKKKCRSMGQNRTL